MSMIYCHQQNEHIDTDTDVDHINNCDSCNYSKEGNDIFWNKMNKPTIKPNIIEEYNSYIIKRVRELENNLKSAEIRENKHCKMIEDIYKLTNNKQLMNSTIVAEIHWLIYESFYNVRK